MTARVTPLAPASSVIAAGGASQVVFWGPLLGGRVVNPSTAADQGLAAVEDLFISLTGPAGTHQTPTTFPIAPGASFDVPAGDTLSVYVNAASTGHRFSAVLLQEAPSPPVAPAGPFPPSGPTSLLTTIRSYLYEQYADDEDLQAFVRSFNEMAQQYLDWFNEVGLPVYTGPLIVGTLLDWVAEGLYGMMRPALSSGRNRDLGPLNTYMLNVLPLNTLRTVGPSDVVATSDDVFKRILTWHIYRGDGKVFDVRWLKRRVMRFLIGVDGTVPDIPNTYQVSVTFGVGNQVNIHILRGLRTITGGAIYNRFGFNTVPYNQLRSTFQSFAPLTTAPVFKEAMESGALEFPFQFTPVVNIQ